MRPRQHVCVCVCARALSLPVMPDSAILWTVAYGSSVHRILQARTLKWVTIPFSSRSS